MIGYRELNPRWWSPQSPHDPNKHTLREHAEEWAAREEFEAELQRDRQIDEHFEKERRYEERD